jgi:hypothetical protein
VKAVVFKVLRKIVFVLADTTSNKRIVKTRRRRNYRDFKRR